MVQYEPWLERDWAMIDPLKSFGIEKGKTFAKTANIVKSAASEALALFDMRYETIYEPHNKGKRWFLPSDTADAHAASKPLRKARRYGPQRRDHREGRRDVHRAGQRSRTPGPLAGAR
jgi:hypothetical protein